MCWPGTLEAMILEDAHSFLSLPRRNQNLNWAIQNNIYQSNAFDWCNKFVSIVRDLQLGISNARQSQNSRPVQSAKRPAHSRACVHGEVCDSESFGVCAHYQQQRNFGKSRNPVKFGHLPLAWPVVLINTNKKLARKPRWPTERHPEQWGCHSWRLQSFPVI